MLYDRLKEARKNAKLTQKQVAEIVGIATTTYSGYERGASDPDVNTLGKIMSAIHTDANFLYQDYQDRENPIQSDASRMLLDDVISRHESGLIKKYRALDVHGKELVDMIINKEMERVKASVQKGDSDQIVPFRISEQSAAAGAGTYLGPDAFRTVQIKSAFLPKGSSFGVPVSGDSMEPKYHNGDILIVSEQHPKVGEIGVFILDGSGYVKIRGETELLSINKGYAPIPMNDSIRSCGKVVGVIREDDLV